MRRRVTYVLASIVSAAVLLAACSSSKDDASTPGFETTSAGGAQALLSFDSPREFGGTPVPVSFIPLDGEYLPDVDDVDHFILVGARAYGLKRIAVGTAESRASVGAVDLATGRTVWEVELPGDPGKYYEAPVVSEDGSTVYTACVVEIPGRGTTAGSTVHRLIAVDTESGDQEWSVDFPIKNGFGETVDVISADDDRVLLAVTAELSGTVDHNDRVVAVDATRHEILWTTSGRVQVVAPEVMVVIVEPKPELEAAYPHLAGLDSATGEVLWARGDDFDSAVLEATGIETASGLAVTIKDYGDLERYTEILDPRTGATVAPLPDVDLWNPVRDGDVIYSGSVEALDPDTLATVWKLPSGGRIAPENITFFGGLVYGNVTDSQGDVGVILDGRTGEEIAADIPGAFVRVNEHGALMLRNREARSADLFFVPATG